MHYTVLGTVTMQDSTFGAYLGRDVIASLSALEMVPFKVVQVISQCSSVSSFLISFGIRLKGAQACQLFRSGNNQTA